ncbi:bifunctional biotin--[acetyl-CoA-carboxylase] ligase/biotin operon repressor BirA [Glaciecola sp. SC05]|uniref:bifunctional biotin--[acetyl-CoA-carboxylase] ligase/biotin operon repressor BirA n=1 Tax=Glaciecola sp. SC05 TaxID=1987355 RepID=UPI003526C4D8
MSSIAKLSGRDKTNALRTHIVSMLAADSFISGEIIAIELGITRSSVSNHIKALSALGLDIFSVKGRGYKLAEKLTLLDESRIRAYLFAEHDARILVNNIVGSTNDSLRTQSLGLPQGSVCLAEAQTNGRGRRGRKWVSPFGASIYMSMVWRFEGGYQSLAGLSLLVGIGVNRALKRIGIVDCRLKWPNDVYHHGKKLAGILIEVEGQSGEPATAVIGIGVNIQLPASVDGIDQPYTDVSSILSRAVDRNEFVARLLEELWLMLPQFQLNGLSTFMQQWKDADLYYGQAISLTSGKNISTGISKGIDINGALLLETNGHLKAYHGGEISVRPA